MFPDVLYLEDPHDSPPSKKDEPLEESNKSKKEDLFESDIKLDDDQRTAIDSLADDGDDDGDDIIIDKRKGIGNLANRWPGAVIPYIIDPSSKSSLSPLRFLML